MPIESFCKQQGIFIGHFTNVLGAVRQQVVPVKVMRIEQEEKLDEVLDAEEAVRVNVSQESLPI